MDEAALGFEVLVEASLKRRGLGKFVRRTTAAAQHHSGVRMLSPCGAIMRKIESASKRECQYHKVVQCETRWCEQKRCPFTNRLLTSVAC